jgi:hypothetical protein
MIGAVRGSNKYSKFQYIKRQDIWRLVNANSKEATSTNSDNLAFNDDQVLEDKMSLKFTIKDLAEYGMQVIFYNSSDEVASTVHFDQISGFDKWGEMLFAGSGNSVYIKDIRIKRREKIQYGHDVDPRSMDCWNIF